MSCGATLRAAVIGVTRRAFASSGAAAVCAALLPAPALAQATARIVVLGGGFAGATGARTLRRADSQVQVTLVEPNPVFTARPFSNAVIAGLRDIEAQRFGDDAIRNEGIAVCRSRRRQSTPRLGA
jgi:sulfide dehydrogenase [flavocytochrome c] flavoprotein chain